MCRRDDHTPVASRAERQIVLGQCPLFREQKPSAIIGDLDAFASLVPDGGIVLDLGCGPDFETSALLQRGLFAQKIADRFPGPPEDRGSSKMMITAERMTPRCRNPFLGGRPLTTLNSTTATQGRPLTRSTMPYHRQRAG